MISHRLKLIGFFLHVNITVGIFIYSYKLQPKINVGRYISQQTISCARNVIF